MFEHFIELELQPDRPRNALRKQRGHDGIAAQREEIARPRRFF
jgi:hypothetical protein